MTHTIREVSLDEIMKINGKIPEFEEEPRLKFETKLANKNHLLIAAYIEQQPAGYLIAYDKFGDGSIYCWMAGVIPSFRKQGILSQLMDYQDQWAQSKGYNKIKIKTRNNRRSMLSFLVKNDFYFTEVNAGDTIEENRISLEKKL
ncbi:GNAT family N-acetyltransferase [Candidatus Woesearchaeota archaeon]|nr:GNAT family N-acetyltransferase [Candidatus Woesearchaeota archaeon]